VGNCQRQRNLVPETHRAHVRLWEALQDWNLRFDGLGIPTLIRRLRDLLRDIDHGRTILRATDEDLHERLLDYMRAASIGYEQAMNAETTRVMAAIQEALIGGPLSREGYLCYADSAVTTGAIYRALEKQGFSSADVAICLRRLHDNGLVAKNQEKKWFKVRGAHQVVLTIEEPEQERAPEQSGELVLVLKSRIATARCAVRDNRFVVLAGSHAMAGDTPSLPEGARKDRAKLLDAGVLVAVPDLPLLRFTQDWSFATSSAAAMVIAGSVLSGPGCWRLQGRDITYKEYLQNR
jgi:hypothetical protein